MEESSPSFQSISFNIARYLSCSRSTYLFFFLSGPDASFPKEGELLFFYSFSIPLGDVQFPLALFFLGCSVPLEGWMTFCFFLSHASVSFSLKLLKKFVPVTISLRLRLPRFGCFLTLPFCSRFCLTFPRLYDFLFYGLSSAKFCPSFLSIPESNRLFRFQ